MSDREKLEELRVLFKNGLEIAYSVFPKKLNAQTRSDDRALTYEKLNKIVQGMTELHETMDELLMLVH